MSQNIIQKFSERLKYSRQEIKAFYEGGHRIRHVEQVAKAAPLYSIAAEVVSSRHCNSGHIEGQKFIPNIGRILSGNSEPFFINVARNCKQGYGGYRSDKDHLLKN